MIELIVTFESPLMAQDKLYLQAKTIDEAKAKYFTWWKRYGKDEQYAIDMVIETDVKEIK